MSVSIWLILAVAAATASGQKLLFEDSASGGAVNTRSPGSDGVVVEAAGSPAADGNPDTRIFGLFGGGGLFGAGKKEVCLVNCGPGNPDLSARCCTQGFSQCCFGIGGVGGVYGGGIKPGRCPGLLGLGTNQVGGGLLQPGYGYGGYGAQGGYGGYGAQGGYGNYGGYGGHYGGIGGSPYNSGGYIQSGFNPGFNRFRSTDGEEQKDSSEIHNNAGITFRTKRESEKSESDVKAKELADSEGREGEVNPRLFGLFGQHCSFDYHCPAQLKCCNNGLKSTCQQPSLFG